MTATRGSLPAAPGGVQLPDRDREPRARTAREEWDQGLHDSERDSPPVCSCRLPAPCLPCRSPQVVDPSHGSVLRSHRRAMSCQISSIFSTRLVDPSRTSVVRSHSKVMHGPCRPPQQVSAYALYPPPGPFPYNLRNTNELAGRDRYLLRSLRGPLTAALPRGRFVVGRLPHQAGTPGNGPLARGPPAGAPGTARDRGCRPRCSVPANRRHTARVGAGRH